MAPRFTRLSKKSSLSIRQIVLRTAAFCTLIFVFGAGLVALGLGPIASPAEAKLATGGEGKHKSIIEWADWTSYFSSTTALTSDMTTTSSRPVGEKNLVTTCTVSRISESGLKITRPGSFNRDGFDDLYNVGGTTGSNQLLSGLANFRDGFGPDFDVRCSASLSGQTVPLSGLVIADAESTNGATAPAAPPEYIDAVPLVDSQPTGQPVKWRIIDRWRGPTCAQTALASVNSSQQMRLTTNATAACGTGPMAVAFMESAQGVSTPIVGARVAVKGQGTTAVAVGVVLGTDFGDAPTTYGTAGAVYSPRTENGTEIGSTAASVSEPSFALATFDKPMRSLGTRIDSENVYPSGGIGRTDDDSGSAVPLQSDEDGFTLAGSLVTVTPGQPYATPSGAVTCTGTGWVAGWIDWNRNGGFESNEKSASVPCISNSAVLSWTGAQTAPAVRSVGTTKTYLRLRMGATEAEVASPVGITLEGEVEDHAINVELTPRIVAQKSADPPSGTVVNPDQKITYSLSFQNAGGPGGTVSYFDSLSGLMDDAIIDKTTLTVAGGVTAQWDDSTNRLLVGGTVAPAQTGTVKYTVQVKKAGFGNAVLSNFLAATGTTPPPTPPPTCSTTSTVCTEHRVKDLWDLAKAANPPSGSFISPGEEVQYQVTASGKGGPVQGIVLRDSIGDVLDDADFVAGSARLSVNGAAPVTVGDPVNGTLTTPSFNLGVNATATLSYRVQVKPNGWSRALRNTVSGLDAGQTGPTTCAVCTTTHQTTARVLIEKVGESSSGTWVRMAGSAWELLRDNNGSAGDPLMAAEDISDGLFSLNRLLPGTYWIAETQAPEGFNLLAEPIRLTVAADGSVALLAGGENGVATTSVLSTGPDAGRSVITVRDVPALVLPESGGSGTTLFRLSGVLVLLLFATLVAWDRSRAGARRKPRLPTTKFP